MSKASVRVITIDTEGEWAAALREIPHGYTHTRSWCSALAYTTCMQPFLVMVEDADGRLICPLVERRHRDATDVATPPGVAGFSGEGETHQLWHSWLRFAAKRNWVAGYLGMHPLFAPPWLMERAEPYNNIYTLDLRQSDVELERRMDRNRVREIRAFEDLKDQISEDRVDVTRFLLAEYPAFADRVSLSGAARWSPDTLERLCNGDGTLLLGVGSGTNLEAVHLFGYTQHLGDSLLNVSLPHGRSHTSGMLWYGARRLRTLGVSRLNLGGGVREDDSIAQSKRRWGPDEHRLSALREVYDPDRYEQLCRAAGADPDTTGMFPAYYRASDGDGT